MGSLENTVNQYLNRMPGVKKVIKRVYQRGMYTISPKIKSEGDIVRVSPNDGKEYFFGYYDKSPWDATGRYMLCMQADNTWSDVSPKQPAKLLLIDTENKNKVEVIAETKTWNVQMGCMMQWLGPDYSSRIIYNDYRDGKYVSVIHSVFDKTEKVIPFPIYSVSTDGRFALSLDFSRLYRLRPGYGYYNVTESTENEKLPNKTCVWRIDLNSGEVTSVLNYTDFAKFEPRSEMEGAEHKINHIMLNPSGTRFMVLHRWFQGQRKYTRLITCNVDGTGMFNLSDDDMVSHCFWKNDDEIIAFENKKKTGAGYYLMKDQTAGYTHLWNEIDYDGHPSYAPDGSKVVFDRYPNRSRVASVMVAKESRDTSQVQTIAKVFAPFKYDNDTRCDLHPRWSRDGKKVCFDSVFEGHRGLYVVNLQDAMSYDETDEDKKISVIVPVYNVEKYLERCVKSLVEQTYSNLEIILVDDGSPDSSGAICDELARKYDIIKVIHKINGGLSSARNAGLEVASGDYVAFVDSDDWIAKDIYAACISTIKAYNCDVVDYLPVYTDGNSAPNSVQYKEPVSVEGEEILYDYLYRGQTEICPFSVCRKVYKKSLIENVTFPEGRVNEDIATNFMILSSAERLTHISKIGYYYFQNAESITNGKLKKKDFDLLFASKELCRLSKGLENKEIYRLAKVKLGRSYFSLLAKAAVGGFADDIGDKNKCVKELTHNLRKNYKLLMKAPISKNRKIMITLVSVNFNLLAVPVRVYQRLRNR